MTDLDSVRKIARGYHAEHLLEAERLRKVAGATLGTEGRRQLHLKAEWEDDVAAEFGQVADLLDLIAAQAAMSPPVPDWFCPTIACPGDGRYASPGRGHLPTCRHPHGGASLTRFADAGAYVDELDGDDTIDIGVSR